MPEHRRRPVFGLVDVSGVDLTTRSQALRDLVDDLGDAVPHAVVVGIELDNLRDGWMSMAGGWRRACEAAFARSADMGAHLLFVGDAVRIPDRSLDELIEAFAIDPLFGIVHPRFVDASGTRVSSAFSTSSPRPVNPAVLPLLGRTSAIAEGHSPLFAVRWELVANLALSAGAWSGLSGLLTEYAVRARRVGFRSVVANRAMVTVPSLPDLPVIASDPADRARIVERCPEAAVSRRFLAARPEVRAEERVSLTFADPELLIDGRNLGPIVNGTSKAILGLMDGLRRVRGDRPTTVWVSQAAADYHAIGARYPGWQVTTGSTLPRRYAAALRLSQPWALDDILQLHDAAAVIAYYMHDSIAWDIQYTAPPALDVVWQVAAQCADGLVFNSAFTRARFETRFPTNPAVHRDVVHLSLDPRDYRETNNAADLVTREPFWFIVGNKYDHKHVTPTLDVLTRVFPSRSFVVMGDRAAQRSRRVHRLHSGSTREAVMQAHYAHADVVIFPSFYEGFALPIWNALAYARTVVARDTELVRELAAVYRGPGRLVLFDSEAALVSCLARLAYGQDVSECSLELESDGPVHDWDKAAAQLDSFVERLIQAAPASPVSAMRSLVAAAAAHGPIASGALPLRTA